MFIQTCVRQMRGPNLDGNILEYVLCVIMDGITGHDKVAS